MHSGIAYLTSERGKSASLKQIQMRCLENCSPFICRLAEEASVSQVVQPPIQTREIIGSRLDQT